MHSGDDVAAARTRSGSKTPRRPSRWCASAGAWCSWRRRARGRWKRGFAPTATRRGLGLRPPCEAGARGGALLRSTDPMPQCVVAGACNVPPCQVSHTRSSRRHHLASTASQIHQTVSPRANTDAQTHRKPHVQRPTGCGVSINIETRACHGYRVRHVTARMCPLNAHVCPLNAHVHTGGAVDGAATPSKVWSPPSLS